MLHELSIKNYALIDDLNITIGCHFNIITGETGAGKSILLGALGLLLGQRADFGVVRNVEKKCVVEGVFQNPSILIQRLLEALEIEKEKELIIRREVLPSGRSRAFINDTPVRLDDLKSFGELLIDVHSQQETSVLRQKDYQLQMLDVFCEHDKDILTYQDKFKIWKRDLKQLVLLKTELKQLEEELDYNAYLLNELSEAKLDGGSLEQLEQELNALSNAENIQVTLNQLNQLLVESDSSIHGQIEEATSELNKVVDFNPELGELKNRLSGVSIELADVAGELVRVAEQSELNPERLLEVQELVNSINHLLQKHHVSTVDELIALRELLSVKVEGATVNKERLEQLESGCRKKEEELLRLASSLHSSRLANKKVLEKAICAELSPLGMPNAIVDFSLKVVELGLKGNTETTLLFSSNKGMESRDISKVASGGEMSRFMFVLKYLLAQKTEMPTIIFDEIDTGVSGEIALKMGLMMGVMAKEHQLVSITHLPQVAGLGDQHYYVYKDHSAARTSSNMKMLTNEERVSEIAKMIGGESPSVSALESAKELLKESN